MTLSRALCVLFAVLLVLGCVHSCAHAQIPSAKNEMGDQYRLLVELLPVAGAVPDTVLRFPQKWVGSNQCLPAGFPSLYQRFNWCEVASIRGNAVVSFTAYSREYPAGSATQKVSGNLRSMMFGGIPMDSLKIHTVSADTVRVYVTD